MRYKHVIWDYDGTLFDTYPVMAEAFRSALSEIGITEPSVEIVSLLKQSMGVTTKHYKEQYSIDDAFFEQFEKTRRKAEEENVRPFKGIQEICRAICAGGGTNYLYTHRGESSKYFMDKFGLSPYFADFITSQNNFPRKPSPEAIMFLLNKHGISQNEAIMIGDRDIDIMSAKNAGICACYFDESNGTCDVSDYNIRNFDELYPIVGIDHNER